MKLWSILLACCLFGIAFATNPESEGEVASTGVKAENTREQRAMSDDEDDFSADFDELIRYFQRGIKRFINRMTIPEERQTLQSTIPFIGRLIFRSLSYLGSFLVGALAVPPLLAGNALSLFGLYRPNEPNELISQPVIPTFFGAQQTSNRISNVPNSNAVNDLSEALFRLGQRNQHDQPATNHAEALLSQAAGSNNPVEISEIVNDLMSRDK